MKYSTSGALACVSHEIFTDVGDVAVTNGFFGTTDACSGARREAEPSDDPIPPLACSFFLSSSVHALTCAALSWMLAMVSAYSFRRSSTAELRHSIMRLTWSTVALLDRRAERLCRPATMSWYLGWWNRFCCTAHMMKSTISGMIPPRSHDNTSEQSCIIVGSHPRPSFTTPTRSMNVSHPFVPTTQMPRSATSPVNRYGKKYGTWNTSFAASTAYTYSGNTRNSSMFHRLGARSGHTHRFSRRSRPRRMNKSAMNRYPIPMTSARRRSVPAKSATRSNAAMKYDASRFNAPVTMASPARFKRRAARALARRISNTRARSSGVRSASAFPPARNEYDASSS